MPDYERDGSGKKIKVDPESREETTTEEKWIGYSSESKKAIVLTTEFVEANFSPGLIEQIKYLSKKTGTRWVAIPPGDNKIHSNVPQDLQIGPEIKYLQKAGEKTCLVYSFASALHHIGIKQLASEFIQKSKQIVEQHNTFQKFALVAQSKSKYMNFK